MSEDNKVVPFPSHKIKRQKAQPGANLDQTESQNETAVMSFRKRATFMVSLIATVITASVLTGRQSADRAPASATFRLELEDDIRLAKKLARESLRGPASRGREPTAEDVLRHGKELQSLYSLGFERGALVRIVYNGPPGSERRISNREKFLAENLGLLKLEDAKPKRVESFQDETNRYEVYDMIEGNTVKAKVHFTLDHHDNVRSISVDTQPKSI